MAKKLRSTSVIERDVMKRQGIVTSLFLICILVLGAMAQEAPPPIDNDQVMGGGKITASKEKKGLDTVLSVTIPGSDLVEAIRMLAGEAGINIAVGKDVEGKVSCNLTDVTARTALEAFLRSNGFTYVEREGVLIVVTEEKAAAFDKGAVARRILRRTFRVPYTGKEKEFVAGSTAPAKAEAAKPIDEIVREMLSARGKLAYYERQHLLVVEDDESVVTLIEEFVDGLWEVPIQVYIESKLVEVSLEDGEDYGMRWNTQTKFSSTGARNQKTGVDDLLGTTLDTTAPALGLDRFFSYGIVNSNIELVLEAMGTRKRVDLQANPSILVVNHRTASIVVGQEVPYISSEESTGGNPIRTVEFKEVAVRLDVTPHVREDMILLDVHPAVKSVIGYTEDPREPVISTREAVTNVAMKDSSTLIIGGLVQRNVTNQVAETPWIANIPLVGWFFRQTSNADTKNDLIFLLTPRIVTAKMVRGKKTNKEQLIKEHEEHRKLLTKPMEEHRGEEYWEKRKEKKQSWWRF
jgi:type IV pilus assembly protein PilQ